MVISYIHIYFVATICINYIYVFYDRSEDCFLCRAVANFIEDKALLLDSAEKELVVNMIDESCFYLHPNNEVLQSRCQVEIVQKHKSKWDID